jgi:hypothetical protein
LGIFTTMIVGCSLVTPGRHLRQLMFPTPDTASYNHLLSPNGDVMSKERASEIAKSLPGTTVANDGSDGIPEAEHDRAMRYLSAGLGRRCYCRDEIECILVSSILPSESFALFFGPTSNYRLSASQCIPVSSIVGIGSVGTYACLILTTPVGLYSNLTAVIVSGGGLLYIGSRVLPS